MKETLAKETGTHCIEVIWILFKEKTFYNNLAERARKANI